eukprot:Hpha_TRINITY_DN23676_c0_g1::TRINITY_DN23676_c0_g1_i1::g.57623::m.57623
MATPSSPRSRAQRPLDLPRQSAWGFADYDPDVLVAAGKRPYEFIGSRVHRPIETKYTRERNDAIRKLYAMSGHPDPSRARAAMVPAVWSQEPAAAPHGPPLTNGEHAWHEAHWSNGTGENWAEGGWNNGAWSEQPGHHNKGKGGRDWWESPSPG